MNKHATIKEPPAPLAASRVIFDDESEEAEIPLFLRKNATKSKRAPTEIVEPETPAAIVDPEADAMIELEETNEIETQANSPKTPDLDNMSVEDLRRQQEEIDRRIREKQAEEKAAIIAQIVGVVNTYQIPVDELVEALGGLKVKRKGVKAKPKFQDPASGTTWSGRGKEPAWIKGKDRARFAID
jgi:DNA-binding protein H-NS